MGAINSIFDVARKGLASSGRELGRLAGNKAFVGGGARYYAGLGVAGLGEGAKWASRRSNASLAAMGGAMMGAGYGAFSDDTSIVGGAMMGAGLGAGAVGIGRMGGMGMRAFARNRAKGMGVGMSAWKGAMFSAKASRRYMGRTGGRAFNQIKSAMKSVSEDQARGIYF